MSRARLDLAAVVAAVAVVLAVLMTVGYLLIMLAESDSPAVWFVAALLLGAASAAYGVNAGSTYRTAALVFAGVVLTAMGVLAILSIGLPILVAGALCLAAAAQSARSGSGRDGSADLGLRS